jgi:hypothetical protein
MRNLKGTVIMTDGNSKRLALTYDVINDDGEATAVNKKVDRIVTDKDTLEAIAAIEAYAQTVIDGVQIGG